MDTLSITTLLNAIGRLAHQLKGQEATLTLLLLSMALLLFSLAVLIYVLRYHVEK